MERREVGTRGLSLTVLGFGGAPIGNLYRATSDEESSQSLRAAWQGGIRYFDTAPHYGLGLSERRLGSELSRYPRDDYVISTKVGRLLTTNPCPRGSDLEFGGFDVPDSLTRTLDYSSEGVNRSIEQSLSHLGTDHVDVVYVHDPDDHVDQVIQETLPALARLRDEGVVKAIGAGMNYWQPLLQMVTTSDIDIVMLAGRWTLMDRSGEPLLRACLERGVGVVAAAPFNSGLLSREEPRGDSHFDYQLVSDELLERARELAALCRAHGVSLPVAAIQFPLRHPAVISVVAGFRTEEQSRTAADWMHQDIPVELWSELEEFGDTVGGAL